MGIPYGSVRRKFKTAEWMRELEADEKPNKVAIMPLAWKTMMLPSFVKMAVEWWKTNSGCELGMRLDVDHLIGVPLCGHWSFNWTFSYPTFAGKFHVQHLKVQINYMSEDSKRKWGFKLRCMYNPQYELTPEDRGLSGLSFDTFNSLLRLNSDISRLRILRVFYRASDDEAVGEVKDDTTLQGPVEVLHKKIHDFAILNVFGDG